jgi:hypothetical protein
MDFLIYSLDPHKYGAPKRERVRKWVIHVFVMRSIIMRENYDFDFDSMYYEIRVARAV